MGTRRTLLLALLLSPGAALAQGQGQGQGQGRGNERGSPRGGESRPGQAALISFTAAEQARITAWLAVNGTSLKPLPPGIARNLARGKPLPPGIARRAAPQALLSQLISRPGYEVLVIGTAVVLSQAGTLLVNDLVHSALR